MSTSDRSELRRNTIRLRCRARSNDSNEKRGASPTMVSVTQDGRADGRDLTR